MMKLVDLEKTYESFLKETVKNNPDKYGDFDALEEDIPKLYEKWSNTPLEEADGKTPVQFVTELSKKKELCDYVTDMLENGVEISDLVCDALVNDADADELLRELCYSDLSDAPAFAAELLKQKGGTAAEDIFIDALQNPNVNEKVVMAAYEFLSDGQPQVVDKILELLPNIDPDRQSVFVEILSEYKGNKSIYFWLVTMLYRADNVPLYADLLGKYEDVSAIDVLRSFAEENPEINYMEFLELRNAVERLGGELAFSKDFSDDPLYKFQHPEKNGGSAERDNSGDTNDVSDGDDCGCHDEACGCHAHNHEDDCDCGHDHHHGHDDCDCDKHFH